MNPTEAKRLVVVGTVAAGTLSAVAAFRRGGAPSPRLAVGVFATGTMLAVAAEVAPAVAGGFAVLMLTAATFVVGGDAWAGITAATTSSKVASRPLPKTTGGTVAAGATAGATIGAR